MLNPTKSLTNASQRVQVILWSKWLKQQINVYAYIYYNSVCCWVSDAIIIYSGLHEPGPHCKCTQLASAPHTYSESWTNLNKWSNWPTGDYKSWLGLGFYKRAPMTHLPMSSTTHLMRETIKSTWWRWMHACLEWDTRHKLLNTYTTTTNTTHNILWLGSPHMPSNSIHRIQHVILHSQYMQLI